MDTDQRPFMNMPWTQINTDSEAWTRVLPRLTLGHCPVNELPMQGGVASYQPRSGLRK